MPENRPTVAVSRPDEPFDQEKDQGFTVDFDAFLPTRALFALAAVVALIVGVTCTAVGLILTAPGATWTGLALLAGGALALRVLWVRGEE